MKCQYTIKASIALGKMMVSEGRELVAIVVGTMWCTQNVENDFRMYSQALCIPPGDW